MHISRRFMLYSETAPSQFLFMLIRRHNVIIVRRPSLKPDIILILQLVQVTLAIGKVNYVDVVLVFEVRKW